MGTEECVFPFKCAARSECDENWQCTVLVMGSHRARWGLWQNKRGMSHLKGAATAQLEPVVDNGKHSPTVARIFMFITKRGNQNIYKKFPNFGVLVTYLFFKAKKQFAALAGLVQ